MLIYYSKESQCTGAELRGSKEKMATAGDGKMQEREWESKPGGAREGVGDYTQLGGFRQRGVNDGQSSLHGEPGNLSNSPYLTMPMWQA